MKTKMRNLFNILLSAILGFLGYGCETAMKYGTPTANLLLEGEVTNEEKESLHNMQIVHRDGWKDNEGIMWNDEADTIYTNAEGKYNRIYNGVFALEYHKVIVNDTAGVYQSDSAITNATFSGGDGDWYLGNGELRVNFILKKK